MRRREERELLVVLLGLAALAVFFTFPLALHIGSVGRVDNGDGQFSIWNVAWVARALIHDPLHVFDANIFYPHRGALTYSEANIGEGAVAVPVYLATHNAYAAHNFVLLISFVVSGAATYYLVRRIAGDRRAAAVAAISFAFCPYVLAHTPHIQLMMTAGLPLSMLALHRLVDGPGAGRGAVLGLAMTGQAYFCGYYAVFVGLMVGYAVLVLALKRQLWRARAFWTAMLVAAAVAIASALPLVIPYVEYLRATGFTRLVESAREFSASWRDYFASPSYAHAPLLRLAGHRPTADMLFPGFVALALGLTGTVVGWRAGGRLREATVVYAGMALLALWLSFGPAAGFYTALYATVPGFTFLRAPGRFGLVVIFGLTVLSGIGLAAWLRRAKSPAVIATVVTVVAIGELVAPIQFPRVPPVDEAYRVLATLPPGPVLELPVYSRRFGFVREAYMLNSTVHWMPLIDAYSDYIPDDFSARMDALADFPSREAFAALEPMHARYAVFHLDAYSADARAALDERLETFAAYLARRYAGGRVWLYEIVGYPR